MAFREGRELSLSVALEDTAQAVDGSLLIAARVRARTGRSLGVAAGHGTGAVTSQSPRLKNRAELSRGVPSGHHHRHLSAAGFLCQPGSCSRAPQFLAIHLASPSTMEFPCIQPAAVFGEGRLSMFPDVSGGHLLAVGVDATTGSSSGVAAGHGTVATATWCPRVDSRAAGHAIRATIPKSSTACNLSSTRHWQCTHWLLKPTPLFVMDRNASFPHKAKKRRMNGSPPAQVQPLWINRIHSSWRAVSSVTGWIMHGINMLFQRMGNEPPLLMRDWSWIGVMGAPVVQFDNAGSCTISACTSCTEAQHRLVHERKHGWGSFPCKARIPPHHLRQECLKRKVWDAVQGAWTEDVFKTIRAIGGIPTTKSTKGTRLTIDGYTVFLMDLVPAQLTCMGAAKLLYVRGPFVGVLWAYDNYDKCCGAIVYRGCPEEKRNLTGTNQGRHAVVCYAYEMVGGELRIQIMDSYTSEGPCRWILFEAFDCFILPTVNVPLELP